MALLTITVMYKTPGFDPKHGDWRWVKFNPDGSVATTPRDPPAAFLWGKISIVHRLPRRRWWQRLCLRERLIGKTHAVGGKRRGLFASRLRRERIPPRSPDFFDVGNSADR